MPDDAPVMRALATQLILDQRILRLTEIGGQPGVRGSLAGPANEMAAAALPPVKVNRPATGSRRPMSRR